ncbi:MAG: hybrid sensor histidine kinase/response regulator, partial [Pseudomonas sp. PGPPP3]
MNTGHGWNIRTHTLLISLGPALLLTVLLTSFFTLSRLHDLRDESTNTGQLIANQLATATEYGVLSGNPQVLKNLLQATLQTPQVRFLEVRDSNEKILVYVEQKTATEQEGSSQVELFNASIQMQSPNTPALNPASDPGYLGRVVVGMSNDAFNTQQQLILLKASALALGALVLTFLLAWRLASRLSTPISAMAEAVKAIQAGNFQASVPERGNVELVELARHINNLASGLQQAQGEQQQANRAKSDFLAMMSHELRTPMNGVLGMLQLLETTEMSREQAEYTALATESTEHLLKVINDILDFSRIERDALELECIPFNLLELLQSSAQAFQHSAQQRGLQLQ